MRYSMGFGEFVEDVVLGLIIGAIFGAAVFFAVVYYRGYQDGHSKERVSKELVEFALGRDLENPLDKLQEELVGFEAPVEKICAKEAQIADSSPGPERRQARRELAALQAEVKALIERNGVVSSSSESLTTLKTRFCGKETSQ